MRSPFGLWGQQPPLLCPSLCMGGISWHGRKEPGPAAFLLSWMGPDVALSLLFLPSGFDCRCGNLFCAIHRYSDMHACPYDYKAEAAEKIRKENPIVIAEKIQKL